MSFTQACVCADSHNLPYCKCMQVHIISFTVSETVVRDSSVCMQIHIFSLTVSETVVCVLLKRVCV